MTQCSESLKSVDTWCLQTHPQEGHSRKTDDDRSSDVPTSSRTEQTAAFVQGFSVVWRVRPSQEL